MMVVVVGGRVVRRLVAVVVVVGQQAGFLEGHFDGPLDPWGGAQRRRRRAGGTHARRGGGRGTRRKFGEALHSIQRVRKHPFVMKRGETYAAGGAASLVESAGASLLLLEAADKDRTGAMPSGYDRASPRALYTVAV